VLVDPADCVEVVGGLWPSGITIGVDDACPAPPLLLPPPESPEL
jgi:hypothetical protein